MGLAGEQQASAAWSAHGKSARVTDAMFRDIGSGAWAVNPDDPPPGLPPALRIRFRPSSAR